MPTPVDRFMRKLWPTTPIMERVFRPFQKKPSPLKKAFDLMEPESIAKVLEASPEVVAQIQNKAPEGGRSFNRVKGWRDEELPRTELSKLFAAFRGEYGGAKDAASRQDWRSFLNAVLTRIEAARADDLTKPVSFASAVVKAINSDIEVMDAADTRERLERERVTPDVVDEVSLDLKQAVVFVPQE